MNQESQERFTATYQICASSLKEAQQYARDTALEQTVECPYELIADTPIEHTAAGCVEKVSSAGSGFYRAVISYEARAAGSELTELLNMLFGNTSLKPGFRLESFRLDSPLYSLYKGPRFGIQGIRKLTEVPSGPILMSAIKPLGRTPSELAHMVYELALGGCPLIKDDHSLYSQSYAPFKERVARCAEAVQEANHKTGGHSLYIANCSADGTQFMERCFQAKELGASGIMAAPALTGFGAVRELSARDDFGLPVFIHPCFSGGMVLSSHSGIAPGCYYGQISRLSGADAVIFTSYGGRFSFSSDTCRDIAQKSREPMGPMAPIFPIPSGGMHWELFHDLKKLYGPDTIFLVGGALQTEGPDLTENTRFFINHLNRD